MASVGQELKKEREVKGISLKEIADHTKINLRFLQDLEEDNFEFMPGKFLTRSIIRSYANYLGLDEKQILDLYLQTISDQGHVPEEVEDEVPSTDPENKNRKPLSYALIAALLIVILSVFLWVILKKTPPEETPPPEQETFVQEEDVPPPILEPLVEEKSIDLALNFQQDTWIQVFADGEIKLDALKRTGESFFIKAYESIRINTGNAGGFSYTINGESGRPLGRRGDVVKDTLITLDNYKEFLQQE
jgi:cytoskeletal protein RodZ